MLNVTSPSKRGKNSSHYRLKSMSDIYRLAMLLKFTFEYTEAGAFMNSGAHLMAHWG